MATLIQEPAPLSEGNQHLNLSEYDEEQVRLVDGVALRAEADSRSSLVPLAQVRLMEERCIVVNPADEAVGEASKKTCACTCHFPPSLATCELIVPLLSMLARPRRPPDDQHPARPPAPRLLRLSLPAERRQAPPAEARRRKDHFPEHVDQHLLQPPAEHQGGARRGGADG